MKCKQTINSRVDLNKYLEELYNVFDEELFFLVRYGERREIITFSSYAGVFYEKPCIITEENLTYIEFLEKMKDIHGDTFIAVTPEDEKNYINGVYYDFYTPQVMSFLTFPVEIEGVFTKKDLLKRLVKNNIRQKIKSLEDLEPVV